MSEEKIEYKINVPMFEVGELERFDNHIHEIIEEYSKMMFKEKDQILTQRIIMKQEEEIERLNNIINEINSIVEYWGYDKEHNDISSFRMAMKNIKEKIDRIGE